MTRHAMLLAGGLSAFLLCAGEAGAEVERFIPRQGGSTEVWRLTNRPERRDWANYHNSEAWSPDGRYVCFESFADEHEIHLFDLQTGTDRLVDVGTQPRWANRNNWLFYLRKGAGGDGLDVMWLDVDGGRTVRIGSGVRGIGETDADDRWLFGNARTGIVRVPIREDARVEDISAGGALGSFMIPNPRHPLVMFRGDSRGADGRDLPYAPTRVWSDLEGNNVVTASPMIQRCHQSWSGDGTYHLHGNSQVRGRRWDQPFPSNLEYLAALDVNDVGSCGTSGRWVIGSGNIGPMPIADLRSGDGRVFLRAALSFLHDSRKYSYSNGSGLHDNDAKGSPDGTKVVLSSNYDLKEGPVTSITRDVPDPAADSIPVESTAGFPPSGRLSVQNEVIGYAWITPTSFEGLTRQMYDTMPLTGSMLEDLPPDRRELYAKRPDNAVQLDRSTDETLKPYLNKPLYLSKGIIVTSFDARLVPEDKRRHSLHPPGATRETFQGDFDSILQWQRHTDLYVAVVRRPDSPWLREVNGQRELIPGENHWETRGYHVYRDGTRVTQAPLAPGATFRAEASGSYTATAVEWSGLESEPSPALTLQQGRELYVRPEKPGDFQWTSDRWLIAGQPAPREKAAAAEDAVREVVHLVEGVVHREWYNWGVITRRHDLNAEGHASRRLWYRGGVLERREYHDRAGRHLSTEWFAPDGHVTEAVRYRQEGGEAREIGHWWFENGLPVKLIGSEGHTLVSFPGIYSKAGDDWIWRPLER